MNNWQYMQQYFVSSTETDAAYECRPSALFALLQKTIVQHAKNLGLNRDNVLANYNCYWMVMRIVIRLQRPIIWGETVRAVSQIRKPTGTRQYWDCDFYVNDQLVGEATTVWVLANRKTKKPIELDHLPEFPTQSLEGEKTETLSRITFPAVMEQQDIRKLYYSDIDINGHISNIRYVDLACDAAELNLRPHGVFLKEIQIAYIGECYAGEELILKRGKDNHNLYVHGCGRDGSPRFDCRMKMSSTEDL